MRLGATDVNTYVEAPEKRRRTLVELRDLCHKVLTDFEESMDHGMPCYKRDGTTEIAFASRKNYISLYVLRQNVLDSHRNRLAGVNCGKGCVRYTSPTKIDFEIVRSMLEATAAAERDGLLALR
jgi:uncharacterized protein YdhG (YjbR/CyaY superfamily)